MFHTHSDIHFIGKVFWTCGLLKGLKNITCHNKLYATIRRYRSGLLEMENFYETIRATLKVDDTILSNEKLQSLWNKGLEINGDGLIALQHLLKFVKNNKKYYVAFITQNDKFMSDKIDIQRYIEIHEILDRAQVFNACEIKLFDKSVITQGVTTYRSSIFDVNTFNAILSFDPQIDVESINERMKKLGLITDDTTFENVSHGIFDKFFSILPSKNIQYHNIIQLLYDKHFELNEHSHQAKQKKIENHYKRIFEMVKDDQLNGHNIFSRFSFKNIMDYGDSKSIFDNQ